MHVMLSKLLPLPGGRGDGQEDFLEEATTQLIAISGAQTAVLLMAEDGRHREPGQLRAAESGSAAEGRGFGASSESL